MQKAVVAIILIVVIAMVGVGLWSFQDSQQSRAGKTASITIGTTAQELNTLLYIAEERNLFAPGGLTVTLKYYDSGRAAVDGMLKNAVDLAAATEMVIVIEAFAGEPVRNMGTIARSQTGYLIGRTDQGIQSISDLKGKKISLPKGTIAEFHLARFLELHGMSAQQVSLVDVRDSQSVEPITNGDVAAAVVRQPYAQEIRNLLGDRTAIWPVQSSQLFYWNVVGTDAWIAKHPDLVTRFLKSLAEAEEYLVRNPNDAKAIVQKRLEYEAAYLDLVWPEHHFSLSLDQSLVAAMQDEARWMIKNNLTPEKTIPDFVNYIYFAGLEAVKPNAMNIIR
ncbi:MAG: NrtA/SsuA/CpmA family ABC transporter substrate-binding protein [Chloroflexi bacterium]|nr:NrtA/SsuA/CpmA family ABC transporter substrate-binding protein [Chloroflexota bacterium]